MNRRNRIFQDQVVVITGASSGIGRTTAICLGRHNALVVLVSRNMEKLASVRDLILENGGQAIAIQADVSHPDARSCEGALDLRENSAGKSRTGDPERNQEQ